MPIRPSSVSSSLPAGPTKGSPCRSSLKPGASPTIITSDGQGPLPGTAWVRVACSPHSLQARTSVCRRSRSGAELSDFDSCLERDQVAGGLDRLHDRVLLLIGERHKRQPERTG